MTLGLLKGLLWQEDVTDQNILRKASAAPDGGRIKERSDWGLAITEKPLAWSTPKVKDSFQSSAFVSLTVVSAGCSQTVLCILK